MPGGNIGGVYAPVTPKPAVQQAAVKKKKPKNLGLGVQGGIGGSIGPERAQGAVPTPSPGEIPRKISIDDKVGMIANSYHTQTGLIPSADKVLPLLNAKMPLTSLQTWNAFMRQAVYPTWVEQAHAIQQQALLGEAADAATIKSMDPGQFWSDYVVQPGKRLTSSNLTYQNLGSGNATATQQLKYTNVPTTQPLTETSTWGSILENTPFAILPGMQGAIKGEQHYIYPRVKNVIDLTGVLIGTAEDRFNQIMEDKFKENFPKADPLTNGTQMTTQKWVNMLEFGANIKDALSGDKGAWEMCKASGYVPDITPAKWSSQWTDDEIRSIVYQYSRFARDPHQSGVAFDVEYSKDKRWAPQSLQTAYHQSLGPQLINDFYSAVGDLGFTETAIAAQQIHQLLSPLRGGPHNTLQQKIVAGASRMVDDAVQIFVSNPLKYGMQAFATAQHVVTFLGAEAAAQQKQPSIPHRTGPRSGQKLSANVLSTYVKANLLDANSPHEALVKAGAIESAAQIWKRTAGELPAVALANYLGLPKDNFAVGLGTFAGEMLIDIGIGRAFDIPLGGVVRSGRGVYTKIFQKDMAPRNLIAHTDDMQAINEMLMKADVVLPTDALHHLEALSKISEPEKVQAYFDANIQHFANTKGKMIDLGIPMASVIAEYMKYTDPKIPTHTRSTYLPVVKSELVPFDRTIPTEVYNHCVHAGVDPTSTKAFTQEAWRGIIRMQKDPVGASSALRKLVDEVNSHIDSMNETLPASAKYTATTERAARVAALGTEKVGTPVEVNGVMVREVPGVGSVDASIADHVYRLNEAGYTTFGSHSGAVVDHVGAPAENIPGYIEFKGLSKQRLGKVTAAAEKNGFKLESNADLTRVVAQDQTPAWDSFVSQLEPKKKGVTRLDELKAFKARKQEVTEGSGRQTIYLPGDIKLELSTGIRDRKFVNKVKSAFEEDRAALRAERDALVAERSKLPATETVIQRPVAAPKEVVQTLPAPVVERKLPKADTTVTRLSDFSTEADIYNYIKNMGGLSRGEHWSKHLTSKENRANYAQLDRVKGGYSLDEMASIISEHAPQFGIHTGEDLWAWLQDYGVAKVDHMAQYEKWLQTAPEEVAKPEAPAAPAAPAQPIAAGTVVEPGYRQYEPWNMTSEELRRAAKAEAKLEDSALLEALGPEGLADWNKAERIERSYEHGVTPSQERMDWASATRNRLEAKIRESGMEQRVFGTVKKGEALTDYFDASELKDLGNRIAYLEDAGTPAELASRVSLNVHNLDPKVTDPWRMTPKQRAAYIDLSTANRVALERGWDTGKLSALIFQHSAARLGGHAEELLSQFVSRKPKPAAKAKPEVVPETLTQPNPRVVEINKRLQEIGNEADLNWRDFQTALASKQALEEHGMSVPAVEPQLANHAYWNFDNRTLAIFNSGDDMLSYMSPDEKRWEAGVTAYDGAGVLPWYDVVNNLVDKIQAKHLGRRLDVIQQSEFHGISVDKFSKVRKMMVLFRLATIVNIVMGDEAIRSMIGSGMGDHLNPKQLAGIFNQKLHERWGGVDKALEDAFKGNVRLNENFVAGLLDAAEKRIKHDTWITVETKDPNFPKAASVAMRTFNAQKSQTIADWLSIYDNIKKIHPNEDIAPLVNQAWQEHVLTDPYFTNKDAPGYRFLAETGRFPVFGKNSVPLMKWIDDIDNKCQKLASNNITRRHLETGHIRAGDLNTGKGTRELYGPVQMPVPRYPAQYQLRKQPTMKENLQAAAEATGGIHGKAIEALASGTELLHPVDATFDFLGRISTRLKRSTFTNVYDASVDRLHVEHPDVPMDEIRSQALEIAYHETAKMSYMLTHSLMEEKLRNSIMFLPAYRQFWQYWSKKAIHNPFTTAAILQDAQTQPTVKLPSWMPLVGPVSWATNNIGFFSANMGVRSFFPPVGFIITDPIQVAAIVGNTKATSMYGVLTGMATPGYMPASDWIDDLVWSASGGKVSWAQIAGGITGGIAKGGAAQDLRRENLIISEVCKQFIEGGPNAMDPAKAKSDVEKRVAGRGLLKFFLPGNIKLTPELAKAGNVTIDFDQITQAQRQYLSAEGDAARAAVLKQFPVYAPIAKAWKLTGNAQLEYLSKNPWVIPFVVRRTSPVSGMSNVIAPFYTDVQPVLEHYTAETIATEIQGRYKQVQQYVLAKSYQDGIKSLTTSVASDKSLQDIAKRVGKNNIAYTQRQKVVLADALINYDKNFFSSNSKDIESILGITKDTGLWQSQLAVSSANIKGWGGIYQSMKSLEQSGDQNALQFIKHSDFYRAYVAQKKTNEMLKLKLQLEFVTAAYKDETYGKDISSGKLSKVTLEPGGTPVPRAEAMLSAIGLTGDEKQKVSEYLVRVVMWQQAKKQVKMGTKDYKAIDAKMKADLLSARKGIAVLNRTTGQWLQVLGFDKPKLPGTKDDQAIGAQAWKMYNSPHPNINTINAFLKDKSKGAISAYHEYQRAFAWNVLISMGEGMRQELLTTKNKQGWSGNSLASKLGKEKVAIMGAWYSCLRQVFPSFASQCDNLFGSKPIWKYILDPKRD
jgi:hypothetical protein